MYMFNDVVFIISKKEVKSTMFSLGKSKKKEERTFEALIPINEHTTVKQSSNEEDFIGDVIILGNSQKKMPTYFIHTEDAKRWNFLFNSAVKVIKEGKETFNEAHRKKQGASSSEPKPRIEILSPEQSFLAKTAPAKSCDIHIDVPLLDPNQKAAMRRGRSQSPAGMKAQKKKDAFPGTDHKSHKEKKASDGELKPAREHRRSHSESGRSSAGTEDRFTI